MIGAVIFVIFFVLFTLISLVIDLPPGSWVVQELIPDIQGTEYVSLVTGIINGVIYGIIAWLVFSLAKMGRKKERVKPAYLEKAAGVKEPKESKPPMALTEIKGIGPKRAEELKAAGVTTVSDLAKRSAKNLSEKTGIPLKNISEWIVQANEMIE